jgi:hypothetical protein
MNDDASRWREFEQRIERPKLIYCATCGAMLPRWAWLGSTDAGKIYCSPACEALEARVEMLEQHYASVGELG